MLISGWPAGQQQLKKKSKPDNEQEDNSDEEECTENGGEGQHEIPGERIDTATVARGDESTIHTALEYLNLDNAVSYV